MTTGALFNVKDPQGNIYGPADLPTLRQWIKEGRILGTMEIAPEGSETWRPTATYPGLADLFTPATPQAGPASTAGYSTPAGAGYGQAGSYGHQPQYATTPPTNGMATASFVCSLVGCGSLLGVCCCLGWALTVGSVLGIIFGKIAQNQIRASNGQQTGEGLAKAGIIIGIVVLIIMVLYVLAYGGFMALVLMKPELFK